MAADSRLTNTTPSERDQAQKVMQCGARGICGVSGNLVLAAKTTDDTTGRTTSHDVNVMTTLAKAAPKIPTGTGQRQADFLAGTLFEPLQTFWKLAFDGKRIDEPMNPAGKSSENSVFTLLFAKRGPGSVEVFEIRFPFREQPRASGGWANSLLAHY